MLPLLMFLGDGGEHSLREAIDSLADQFSLTEAERAEMLPSGQQGTFNNRVAWARTYLKKAGLLESTRRGFFRITERGKKVLAGTPARILVKMGYGGSRREAGQAFGKSGDGGIDGIIKEDKLGLDIIYIQAKRWDGSVGRPEVQKFAGALQGQRAKKGIFITTPVFTKDATDYAAFIDTKIILNVWLLKTGQALSRFAHFS
jgi:restriction endonuclease Mrr